MQVLIIDDEANIRKTTAVVVDAMGHDSLCVENRATALRELSEGHFDVAFLDLKLGAENGLDLLPEMLKINPKLDVAVFTAYASIETAVEAMRRGAQDYVPKPFTPEQIRQVLTRMVKTRKLQGRLAELESRLSSESPTADLTSADAGVQKVFEVAFKAAASPASIIILGENGTGKSILARAIHDNSPQKEAAFVTVSCPSLSRELLESELFGHVKGAFTGAANETWGKVALADGGTLFLDEIGELPMEIQPKLLRLLQEKEYERVGEAKPRRANVRIIAATNRNLEQAVKDGRFREDLFYRLNVISLHMPPMRERLGDLLKLTGDYVRFFSAQCKKPVKGFSPRALAAMQRYPWPGNLRELRNLVERAVILVTGEEIDLADLPNKFTEVMAGPGGGAVRIGGRFSLEELESEHIRLVVEKTETMEEASRILGIDPATLYRKRKRTSGQPVLE
jgi:two-component system, NtrC family, response regulator AlgB